ncbi:hypothetical protein C8Q80DRAFT_227854 [Daedaleopsis nitida]|nr:hypothetical protein C8Q80DRAFT_227854 [Daedaleopsis nitida]
MSSPDLVQLTQVIAHLAQRHIRHSAAASTLLLFDLIAHLDEEVQLVWRSGNTLPKYLYFISRYYGILGQFLITSNVFPMFCFSYILISLMFLLPLLLSVELSLMLRVDALYAKNKNIRLIMMCGIVAELTIALAFEIVSLPNIRKRETPFPPFTPARGCISRQPALIRLTWIPVLAFDTLLFALNTIKCISYGPLDGTPIIYRLFRDGSAYYVIIFVCILICTLAQFFASLYSSIAITYVRPPFSPVPMCDTQLRPDAPSPFAGGSPQCSPTR